MEKIQLEKDEKVLMQVRKHWFILFIQMFSLFIVAILPIIATTVLSWLGFFDLISKTVTLSGAVIVALFAAWLLMVWMALFNVWTNYYLDVWTITNKRLVTVDQRGLFHRNTGSFRLERLQDMNIEINGILATFLNYGVIEAQTAGEREDDFRAYGLPDPRGLKSVILKATDELMQSYGGRTIETDGV